MIAGLLALTLTALTAAGIAVRNAATASRQHVIACPASSLPKASTSMAPSQ